MSEIQNELKSYKNTETEELAGIFSGITSIRALAIIAVMWTHYGINFSSITGPNLVIHGLQEIADIGVDLFVFLSGMLFTINMFLRNSQEHSWKNWYKRRIIRIYPLLIISTLIYLLPYFIFLGKFFSINSVIMHMSGLQSFPTNSNYFLFASAHWYITFILSCYVLFPLL
ncbi:MAG: acyltransferase family protein, partial [Candidatus Hodarchaeota archaeon]